MFAVKPTKNRRKCFATTTEKKKKKYKTIDKFVNTIESNTWIFFKYTGLNEYNYIATSTY